MDKNNLGILGGGISSLAFAYFYKENVSIIEKESTTPVLQNTLKESHVGILVPDLTPIVNSDLLSIFITL